jgi:hypothetical protein
VGGRRKIRLFRFFLARKITVKIKSFWSFYITLFPMRLLKVNKRAGTAQSECKAFIKLNVAPGFVRNFSRLSKGKICVGFFLFFLSFT